MSKTAIPFAVDDVSALAKSLHSQLTQSPESPGHVALLNMLARSAGFRNFQHLRAAAEAEDRLAAPTTALPPTDFALVEKIVRYFDDHGRLIRWPGKASHREPCLWVLWSRIVPRRSYREAEINAVLTENHRFGDYALLRREMFDRGMVNRTPDGREYRRIEARPSAEAAALIRILRERREPRP
jgi:hypothetical protein